MLRIPESGKVLLQVGSGIHHIFTVKSGILDFGIRNTAQGIWNPTNDWNPESKFHLKIQESRTRTLESTAWNPESKAVLESLTWREQTIFCTIFALQSFRAFEQASSKLKHQITNSAQVYPSNIPVINFLHNFGTSFASLTALKLIVPRRASDAKLTSFARACVALKIVVADLLISCNIYLQFAWLAVVRVVNVVIEIQWGLSVLS